MIFLQTPHISSLGLMSGLFKDTKRKCNFFIGSFFWHVMPQFSDKNITSHIALWYIMISEIWNFFTWIKSQHTIIFPIFINVSFTVLYTLPGIYLTFIAIIGWKPPCSYKLCLLSIKNYIFFSILIFYDSKCSKGFI